jgi:hypothetical protein
MNEETTRRLASYWQKILRTEPRRVFRAHFSALRSFNEDDWIAQPGYVGSHYKCGGLVFIAANPGGPKSKTLPPSDRQQYKLLQVLRKAKPPQRVRAFKNLNRYLCQSMKRWNIYATYIPDILQQTGIKFSDIAFINLVKRRTVGQKMPRELLELSWHAHSRDQVMLLRPSVIICLGNTAGRFIQRVYGTVIPRTIKDGYLSDASREAVNRARRYLLHWRGSQN